MFLTSSLFRETAVAKGKTVAVKKIYFSEILPLCLKNKVNQRKTVPAGSQCIQELQSLFGCLKKWEYDDIPCASHHKAYMECVRRVEKTTEEQKEAMKQGILGEAKTRKSATAAHLNKIMSLFPQPDLGKHPYRQMKRLPTQSYADDIFHRKDKKGKRS
ncbi:hypothetical protein AB6A40_000613 [Gnathostoma spinigerum]|uniref:CHCH domain-containing protein n=1 Tax=Gnathostoma spinigerum TaxID=75299 RepID=A0ABD6E2F8_9BILA